MAYSKEEQEMWEAKDRRIVKQSMLKAAVDWQKGNPKLTVQDILTVADAFVDWVYNERVANEVVGDITGPHPTLEQKEALKKVEEATGWTEAQVYAKFKKYPTKETTDKCIKAIKDL